MPDSEPIPDFERGFHDWMTACLRYEWYKQHNEAIPADIQKDFDEGFEWLNNLSGEDYSKLIS